MWEPCRTESLSVLLTLRVVLLLLVPTLACSSSYRVPPKPVSIATTDIDRDGDMDVILGHEVSGAGGLVSILCNDGSGVLTLIDTLSTGAYEESIQLGNVDGDDRPDIVMLDYDTVSASTAFRVIYGYGSYRFDSTRLFSLGKQMTVWDWSVGHVRYSSHEDIVFISSLSQTLGVLYNTGSGGFTAPTFLGLDFSPASLATADLDADARDDLIVCGTKVLLLWNRPTGFESRRIDTLSTYFSDVKVADMNNDGRNDIICCDWGVPGSKKRIIVFEGDSSDQFQQTYSKWVDQAMARICLSDINNDGYLDVVYNCSLYYPNSDSEVFRTYVMTNNRDGSLSDPVSYSTGICSDLSSVVDLDGDGWKDIVTLNYDFYNPPPESCSVHILFNDRAGHFQENPVTDVREKQPQPALFVLYQNYPNPFNLSTVIRYRVSITGWVSLRVSDVLGRDVATLADRLTMPGEYRINWIAAEDTPSGVYLVRLTAGSRSMVKKIVLLK